MHVFHGITLDYVVLRGDMTNKKRKGRRTLRVLLKNDANGSPAAATIENKTPVLDEVSINLKAARSMWGPLPRLIVKNLQELTKRHRLSVKAGDVSLLGSQLYITHSGLLRIGERRRCSGIGDIRAERLIGSDFRYAGSSGRQYSNHRARRDSLATVMPILPIHLR